MSNIHFRIDETTKRLAMQAAERKNTDLTKLVRQRVEQLAAEEQEMQSMEQDRWLENAIAEAFEYHENQITHFISDDEMKTRMDVLKAKALKGDL